MIDRIQSFYYLTVNLFYVLFFSFLYIPLFNNCNVKKKVKKNGKTKIISQPKSVLAFTYLTLLFILFKCFTFKMILFVVISVIIGSLIFVDKMSPSLNESLYKFNKSQPAILCWKLLHTVFTIVDMLTNPLFSIINIKINHKLSTAKNFITKVANLNLSNGSNGSNDSNSSDGEFGKELLKISEEMSNMSNVSDYVFKSKNKSEKHKVIKSNTGDDTMSDINTSDCDTSSKMVMIKKINEINQALNETNAESMEDMTITEVPN